MALGTHNYISSKFLQTIPHWCCFIACNITAKDRNLQAFKVGKAKCQATYGHSLDFKSSHELIGFKEQRTCTCRQQQSYLKKNKLVSHSAGHILHCNKLSMPKVRVYINRLLLLGWLSTWQIHQYGILHVHMDDRYYTLLYISFSKSCKIICMGIIVHVHLSCCACVHTHRYTHRELLKHYNSLKF